MAEERAGLVRPQLADNALFSAMAELIRVNFDAGLRRGPADGKVEGIAGERPVEPVGENEGLARPAGQERAQGR